MRAFGSLQAVSWLLLVILLLEFLSASTITYPSEPLGPSSYSKYQKTPTSPNASSSQKRRKNHTPAGIDDPESVACSIPYIDTVPIENAKTERMPLDRLALKDSKYLKYRANKKLISTSASFNRRANNPNFMKLTDPKDLQDWLELGKTSMWQATQILESPNFNGVSLSYLNNLPSIYIRKRLTVPFVAFMNRFEYLDEYDLVLWKDEPDEADPTKNVSCGDTQNLNSISTPFTNLVYAFLDSKALSDPTLDPFFRCLVTTQPVAFYKSEMIFFNAWLRTGPGAWKYIQIYFKESGSSTQSSTLASLLTSDPFNDFLDPKFIELLFKEIPEFDVNVRIRFVEDLENENRLTPLLHVLVLERRLSKFLSNLLKSPLLDVDVPTGKVSVKIASLTFYYVDQPLYFLAGAMFNFWAMIHLSFDERVKAKIRSRDYFLFIIYHIFNIIIRSLVRDLRRLFPVSNNSGSAGVSGNSEHTENLKR